MSKSRTIEKLRKDVKRLKKLVSSDGIIFTDPNDSNTKVFFGIIDGAIITEIRKTTVDVTNVTNKTI